MHTFECELCGSLGADRSGAVWAVQLANGFGSFGVLVASLGVADGGGLGK